MAGVRAFARRLVSGGVVEASCGGAGAGCGSGVNFAGGGAAAGAGISAATSGAGAATGSVPDDATAAGGATAGAATGAGTSGAICTGTAATGVGVVAGDAIFVVDAIVADGAAASAIEVTEACSRARRIPAGAGAALNSDCGCDCDCDWELEWLARAAMASMRDFVGLVVKLLEEAGRISATAGSRKSTLRGKGLKSSN